MKKNLFAFIFYGLLSLFFLRGIIFSPGIISGGDWGFPLTFSQADQYFKSGFYTWGKSLFGMEQFFLNGLSFQFLTNLIFRIGITGEVYAKFLLISAFIFPALSIYSLFKFLDCDKKVAFFGGLLYITLPFFFNYAAMGWLFVLFSMGILPLALIFFIKSVKEEKVVYSILTGVLYFLAMMQSQSLFWYPLVLLSLAIFFIKDRKSLLSYIKSFLVVFLVFLGLNAYLWLPLFFGGGSGVLGTELGLSTASLGTWARLSYLNILRVWGSLFNYQYETSYPQILAPLSFLLPILACSSLIFVRKKKILLSFAVLSFVPLILFSLGPKFIAELPFSDIFRDMARFLVLSSFSYVVMATLFLDFLFKQKKKYLNLVRIGLVILFIVSAYPFLAGEIFGEQKQQYDIRLRTYNFPQGYFDLENSLREEKKDTKVLYLPVGGGFNLVDDKRFYGPFKEIRDIFAGYSSKPGVIGISDRGMGAVTGLIFNLQEKIDDQRFDNLGNLLSLMSVKYVAIRENASHLLGVSEKEVAALLTEQPGIVFRERWDKISLLENNNFLPHFYIPQNIIYSNGGTQDLLDIVGFEDYEIRSGIYLEKLKVKSQKLKIEDSEILNRADEVFVKGEGEDIGYWILDIEKREAFKNSVLFPFVKYEPGSFLYPLVLRREQFEEWKVRKDPEKLIDKKLFYAGKRISEFERFGTENADKELIARIIRGYQAKMEEVIGEIEKLRNLDTSGMEGLRNLSSIKLRAYWERHKEEVGEIYQDKLKYVPDRGEYEAMFNDWEEVFEELDGKIKGLEKPMDLRNLQYSFEIPREGEYGIYMEPKYATEAAKIEIDGNTIEINRDKIETNGEWVKLGEREFEGGKHKLVLHLPELKNLVGNNWQKLEEIGIRGEGVEFSLQTFFPDVKNLISQEINNWQPNNLYYLSFDYKTEGGNLSVGILESKIEYEKENEKIKKEKALDRTLRSRKDGQWKKFETVLRVGGDVLGAEVYFYALADSDDSGKVEFQNLKIYQISQPKVVFRLNTKNTEETRITPKTPKITFVKINPTKYKVLIEEANQPYTLVFSESFHRGWKAYKKDIGNQILDIGEQKRYGEVVASYFDGEIKEGMHKNVFLDKNTFETWGKKPLSEDKHLMVNGYANSWYITPEDVGGKQDYELIIEFAPQRLFYKGLFISGITLAGCLIYLLYNSIIVRRNRQ